MWNKNISLVYACKVDGKYYAMPYKIQQSRDLLSFVNSIPNCLHINVCDSYKQACKIAELWNENYKRNGKNLFS